MPSFAELVHVQYDPKTQGRNKAAIRMLNAELLETPQPAKVLRQRLLQQMTARRG